MKTLFVGTAFQSKDFFEIDFIYTPQEAAKLVILDLKSRKHMYGKS